MSRLRQVSADRQRQTSSTSVKHRSHVLNNHSITQKTTRDRRRGREPWRGKRWWRAVTTGGEMRFQGCLFVFCNLKETVSKSKKKTVLQYFFFVWKTSTLIRSPANVSPDYFQKQNFKNAKRGFGEEKLVILKKMLIKEDFFLYMWTGYVENMT